MRTDKKITPVSCDVIVATEKGDGLAFPLFAALHATYQPAIIIVIKNLSDGDDNKSVILMNYLRNRIQTSPPKPHREPEPSSFRPVNTATMTTGS